jgi:hypothetical protein
VSTNSPAADMATPPATATAPPILDEADAASRMQQLGELHAALDSLGIHCILARNHRLVLRYNEAPLPPSGLTDPRLHIFGPDGMHAVTTDGTAYNVGHGPGLPVSDPAAAAVAIQRTLTTART